MILNLFLSIIIAFRISLTLSASPLLIGLWIIFIALFIAIFLSFFSSWLGIIVFLIYIGGLLVIFAYFVALTPNLIIDSITIAKWILISTFVFFSLLSTFHVNILNSFNFLWQTPISNLINRNFFALTFIALILFFALVAVVKLCSFFSSPLRPYN